LSEGYGDEARLDKVRAAFRGVLLRAVEEG
jgi:hypothetical protein